MLKKTFEKIKKTLTLDLFLSHFDAKLEIIVESDASNYGIGPVNLYKHKDGSVKVIEHASRTLIV